MPDATCVPGGPGAACAPFAPGATSAPSVWCPQCSLCPTPHDPDLLVPVLGGWLCETCLVLTAVTRLARAELLRVVDIVDGTRRGCLVMKVETKAHTRSDNVVAALAANTVTVVVSQLFRGNAIARAIRNQGGVSCKMTVAKLAV